jgi:O-antigen/teichoic acid export membrane protein
MRKLVRAVSWITLAQVTSMFLRMVNGKVSAVFLGPAGMGIMSQLYQIKDLIIQYSSLGIGPGIVKYTAEGIADEEYPAVQSLISSAITVLVSLSLIVVAGVVLFAKPVSWLSLGTPDLYLFLLVFVPTLPLVVVGGLLNNVLVGMKEIRRVALAMILIAFLSVVIMAALAITAGLWGAVIAASMNSAVFFLVYAFFLRRADLPPAVLPRRVFSLDRRILKKLFRFGATTLLVGGLGTLIRLLTRSLLLHRLGAEANGIYQAVLVTTVQTTSIIIYGMGTYMTPRISELRQDYVTIVEEKNNALRLSVLLGTPALAMLILLREWIIPLLTSAEFMPAAELIPVQAIGVLFLLISRGITIGLLVMEHFGAWSAFQLLRQFAWPAFFVLLLSGYGLKSISIAYTLSELLLAVLIYVYHRRVIRFRMTRRNAWLTATAIMLVGFVALTSSAQSVALRYVIPIGLIPVWFVASVSRSERRSAMEWFQSRIPVRLRS